MAANRSYIFFREAPVADGDPGPIAAAKVPLTPGRSLAVDRLLHSFHAPVWIETTLPDSKPLRRLMVAQDTGSAIVGPARGDIFFGSGDAAGEIAGAMRAEGRFVVLVPRGPRTVSRGRKPTPPEDRALWEHVKRSVSPLQTAAQGSGNA